MSPAAALCSPGAARRLRGCRSGDFPWTRHRRVRRCPPLMDQGQAVHAALAAQGRLGGPAQVPGNSGRGDHMATAPPDEHRTGSADQLLKRAASPMRLGRSSWRDPLKDGSLPRARVPQLSPLLFQGGKREQLYCLFTPATRTISATTISSSGNMCFGHGVFRKDLQSYAERRCIGSAAARGPSTCAGQCFNPWRWTGW